MRELIITIDMLTQGALAVFAVSVFMIILSVHRDKLRHPEEPPSLGPWSRVNFLLLWPHREYALRKRNHLLLWINLVSAALFLLGLLLLPLLAWIQPLRG